MHASATPGVNLDGSAEVMSMTRVGRAVKRCLDILISSVLLILLLPLIALLAVIVKCQDGGPMFYRRRVVGLRGDFDAFKLRSMRVDAEEILQRTPSLRQEVAVNFKLKDDARTTP